MATFQDLVNAINDNDLRSVIKLLEERDAKGIPTIYDGDVTKANEAIKCATHAIVFNIRFIETISNIQDNTGKPVIDPNKKDAHDNSLITDILNNRLISPAIKHTVLSHLLYLRGAHGELITDLDGYTIPLLFQAVKADDVDCFKLFANFGEMDGIYELDINQIHAEHYVKKTVLDCAYEMGNRDMINAILARDGARLSWFYDWYRKFQEERFEERLRRLVPQQPVSDGKAVEQFSQDRQNTHHKTVTRTSKGSLIALAKFYPELDEDACIHEIDQLLNQFDYRSIHVRPDLTAANQKNVAQSFWNLCKQRLNETHSHTGFTYKKILSLVWMGIKDDRPESLSDDLRHIYGHLPRAPQSLINIKKSSLIEKFIEAEEYRGQNLVICIGGGIHKIIESLNRSHSQVMICTGDQSIMPAANAMPAAIMRDLLAAKPIREQRSILSHWDDEKKSVAALFRNNAKTVIDERLRDIFDTLLPDEKRRDIVDNLDYADAPILHKELAGLIKTIKDIPDGKPQIPELQQLKEQVHHVYDDNDRSFNDEYKSLLAAYNTCPSLVKLVNLITQIRELLPDEHDSFRHNAIQGLKKRAEKIYRLEIPLAEKIAILEKDYQHFCSLDAIAAQYRAIDKQYHGTNPERKESIRLINLFVNNAYEQFAHANSAHTAIANLKHDLHDIRKALHHDHKTYGAGRVFLFFQTRSRLEVLMDGAQTACALRFAV